MEGDPRPPVPPPELLPEEGRRWRGGPASDESTLASREPLAPLPRDTRKESDPTLAPADRLLTALAMPVLWAWEWWAWPTPTPACTKGRPTRGDGASRSLSLPVLTPALEGDANIMWRRCWGEAQALTGGMLPSPP
jgi:hypothetical protein